MWVLSALVCALAVAVAVAACGGGRSSSKAEFIEAADALCKKEEEEGHAYQRRQKLRGVAEDPDVDSPRGEAKVAGLLREQVEEADANLAGLGKLEPPSGDRQLISRILQRAEAANDLAKASADAVEAGEVPRAESLEAEGQAEGAKAEAGLQEYGFKVCSRINQG
jgi:hypothetical protein